jgi:hypothetical protein
MKKMLLLFLLSSVTLVANANAPVCNPGKNSHDPKSCLNITADTTVPEPSTIALIGIGFSGFAGMAYYRRRKSAYQIEK